VTIYAITSLTFAEDPPSYAPAAVRRSWLCLRNLIIGVLGRAGPVNLAAA
jgi:hypothetical protein